MKKLILLLFVSALLGCSNERDCTEQAQRVYELTYSANREAQTLIITEDTCISGDFTVEPAGLRLNGNKLIVDGDLVVEGFVLMLGGELHVTGSLIVNSNIFFQDTGGTIIVEKGILVSGHVSATSNDNQNYVSYCNFFQYQDFDSEYIEAVQDCSVVDTSDCTLSIGGSNKYGQIDYVSCDYDYSSQELKEDEIGFYKYVRITDN